VIRGRITLGQFVAFNAYLTMLAWPMIAFGWVTNMLQRGMASWKRMLEVLDTEPAIRDEDARLKPRAPSRLPPLLEREASAERAIRGEIEFRDLVFAYGDTRCSNTSPRHRGGQTVALVGVDRVGKSTLISLLARLHDPPPGTVFIDGVDVRDCRSRAARRIGFVPQEPFLFSDTLADNIAFGLDARTPVTRDASRPGREAAAGRIEKIRAPRSRALDKDVATSRRATTRWSASAGSRCRAARSSGPPSRAPCASTRAS
jgi:ATP-binding cassette subfamily B protein